VTAEGLRVLAERADAVVGRPDTRLDELHVRITRARRRRQVGLVGSAVVAVVLALAAGLAIATLTRPDESLPVTPPPVPTSSPTSTDLVEAGPAVRRVTYAEHHRIHWGDQVIDVGQTVQAVFATDDGVVFIRGDKGCPYQVACRTLWFTDGGDVIRIGVTTGSWIRGFGIDFASAGSTVVWSEPDPADHAEAYPVTGEFVAYDTSLRREVGRFGSAQSTVVAVGADGVYWLPHQRQCVDFYGECLRFTAPVMRLDVSTGQQAEVTYAMFRADRSSWPRTLRSPQLEEIAVGDTEKVVRPPHAAPRLGDSFGFRLAGRTGLVADDGSVATTVRLARTGAPLRLRVRPGYPADASFVINQWLDDDRVVMHVQDPDGLLVCRLPDGQCRPTVEGRFVINFGGRG
jgi:hypothetical protein